MKYRNVKLKVLSQEHSAAFQEAVFESGGGWWLGGDRVRHTDKECLFVSDRDSLVLTCGSAGSVFRSHSNKQIHFVTPAYKMTKIRIRNPEHSNFVQKKLLENGCSWVGGFTKAQHTDKPCLTVSETGKIRFCTPNFFDKQAHLKEIFIEDDFMDELTSLPNHMQICPQCGNKRCHKASNFEYKCTGTNDVEQPDPQPEGVASIVSADRLEVNRQAGDTAFKLSPSATYRSALFRGADGYEQLTHVLLSAHNQAAHGKGDERHANGQPFHEQRMQSISRIISSAKGMEFQALKKITEGMQFYDAGRREAELLGAINYIAGIVIYYRNGGK